MTELPSASGVRRSRPADGSNVDQLTHGTQGDTNLYPVWSPDGTKIAYLAGVRGGPGGLVIVNSNGSSPLTLVKGDVLGLSWQPLPAAHC
jgi:Tol biopolymer transport system component